MSNDYEPEYIDNDEPRNNAPANAAIQAMQSRHVQEAQAAVILAKKFPRDEAASYNRIMQACKRTKLAESAIYAYPRGGEKVEGPSIRLAETLARAWGNLDYGIIELDQSGAKSEMMAYCWDLETNVRQTKIFQVQHIRKTRQATKKLDDPRDIYEMTANQGARRLRACILGVIPGDVVDAALDACNKTLTGNSKEPLEDRIRKMVSFFADLGVTQDMLEARLGHKVAACTEHDIASLKKIGKSMQDGMSKREDWFQEPVPESKVAQRLAAKSKEQEAEAPE